MESTYNFEEFQNKASPCFFQLSPELKTQVRSLFAEINFWLALAILSESEEQYIQAVQNSSMLDFGEDMNDIELSQKIKDRLSDAEYLELQASKAKQDLELFFVGQTTDKSVLNSTLQAAYNRKLLNEYNYNLITGESLFPDCLLRKAVDLMPCLNQKDDLEKWSCSFEGEKEELSDILRARSIR